MVLMAALMQQIKKDRMLMGRSEEVVYTALCGFATYMLVYAISGFVPMGYVVRSNPLLPRLLHRLR